MVLGIATILMMWSLPEPEVDISLTILLAIMLCTDKPLCVLWLVLSCWKRFKGENGAPEEKYKVSSNGVVGYSRHVSMDEFPEITVSRLGDTLQKDITPREDQFRQM